MKKNILAILVFATFNANALDVVLTSNKALVQESGLIKNSPLQISEDGKVIEIGGILDTNIPDTFYFKVGDQNAASIFYNKNATSSPLDNSGALNQFLKEKKGSIVSFEKNEIVLEGEIVGFVNKSFFINHEGKTVTVPFEDVSFPDDFFKQENFNLKTYFKESVTKDDPYKYYYGATGFNWKPQYTLTMKDNNKMDFTFYANINNATMTDLKGVDLTLMVESSQSRVQPMRKSGISDLASMSIVSENSMGVASFDSVSASSVEDLTAYKIDGKVDLNSRITSNVLVKEFNNVSYEKQNLFSLPSFSYGQVKNDRVLESQSTRIAQTKLVVPFKDNKELTKNYLPSGSLSVLKAESDSLNALLLPYTNVHLQNIKNEDFEVNLPKNKNVKYVGTINSFKPLKTKGNMITFNVEMNQYFKNNGSKAEKFVIDIPKKQISNSSKYSKEYTREFIKDKGVYRYSTRLNPNEEKNLFLGVEYVIRK